MSMGFLKHTVPDFAFLQQYLAMIIYFSAGLKIFEEN